MKKNTPSRIHQFVKYLAVLHDDENCKDFNGFLSKKKRTWVNTLNRILESDQEHKATIEKIDSMKVTSDNEEEAQRVFTVSHRTDTKGTGYPKTLTFEASKCKSFFDKMKGDQTIQTTDFSGIMGGITIQATDKDEKKHPAPSPRLSGRNNLDKNPNSFSYARTQSSSRSGLEDETKSKTKAASAQNLQPKKSHWLWTVLCWVMGAVVLSTLNVAAIMWRFPSELSMGWSMTMFTAPIPMIHMLSTAILVFIVSHFIWSCLSGDTRQAVQKNTGRLMFAVLIGSALLMALLHLSPVTFGMLPMYCTLLPNLVLVVLAGKAFERNGETPSTTPRGDSGRFEIDSKVCQNQDLTRRDQRFVSTKRRQTKNQRFECKPLHEKKMRLPINGRLSRSESRRSLTGP